MNWLEIAAVDCLNREQSNFCYIFFYEIQTPRKKNIGENKTFIELICRWFHTFFLASDFSSDYLNKLGYINEDTFELIEFEQMWRFLKMNEY